MPFQAILLNEYGTCLAPVDYLDGYIKPSTFDCQLCHTPSNGGYATSGPHFIKPEADDTQSTFTVNYLSIHWDKKKTCSRPINPWAHNLLYSLCGCGLEDENDNYQGDIYLTKHYLGNVVDCTSEDISFVISKLTHQRDKTPHPGKSSCVIL